MIKATVTQGTKTEIYNELKALIAEKAKQHNVGWDIEPKRAKEVKSKIIYAFSEKGMHFEGEIFIAHWDKEDKENGYKHLKREFDLAIEYLKGCGGLKEDPNYERSIEAL